MLPKGSIPKEIFEQSTPGMGFIPALLLTFVLSATVLSLSVLAYHYSGVPGFEKLLPW